MPEDTNKPEVVETELVPAEQKPGYKTTEFWLAAVATIVGLLMSSGLLQTGSTWERVVGLAAAALATMGYSAARARTKATS